ncbi:MAG: hypothetical protein LUD50_01465, partial [Clostridia bacterium]|nr:hypothetical protein [Clostridia bacterium]
MTLLYLDGTRVYFDDSQDIKVTKENPYFTQSGTYTLEVSLPMDILENRKFFKNIQRLQVGKKCENMTTMLVADNHVLLSGTAKVTSISDTVVKVQLTGGNSAFNIIINDEEVYIDEIIYPQYDFGENQYQFGGKRGENDVSGMSLYGGEVKRTTRQIYHGIDTDLSNEDGYTMNAVDGVAYFLPVLDETNDEVKNPLKIYDYSQVYGNGTHNHSGNTGGYIYMEEKGSCICPNLMYVIKNVMAHFGFEIKTNEFDVEPWNRIYIANARKTMYVQEALPHWTVEDFLTQVQYFFNCTFVFSDESKTVEILSNKNYFCKGIQEFEAVDEYTSDVSDEDSEVAQSLASSNIRFDMSDSDYHMVDAPDDEILDAYEHKTYNSYNEIVEDVLATELAEDERMKYIYDCPQGSFVVGREDEYDDDSALCLRKIDHFGKIIRNEENEDYIELKICPVAMTRTFPIEPQDYNENKEGELDYSMPSMANEAGDDVSDLSEVVWEGITEGVDEKSENEDRMQVMFISEKYIYWDFTFSSGNTVRIYYKQAYTDCEKDFTGSVAATENW